MFYVYLSNPTAATLESHFSYKDKVTDSKKLSMVVYKLKCLTEGCEGWIFIVYFNFKIFGKDSKI